MSELPRDLPILEREAVRLVVRDSEDRILLFHTHEITAPELGVWWELPGGGVDEGETYLEAALRELREEAGIRHLQHEVVVEVRLDEPGTAVDAGERLDYELEDYFDFRWWSVDEIVGSSEPFYPGRLPALLERFLDGGEIDEPFELFS